MPEPHPDEKLVTLAVFDSEIAASILAVELRSYDIPTEVSGGLTAGFRAEAPGCVKVLIHRHDLERAREVVAECQAARREIDWDQVDVGEAEEA